MTKYFLLISFLFISQLSQAARVINVNGRAQDSLYCNPTSGSFCIDDLKRRTESESSRDARWTCEMNYRGTSRTYTAFTNSFCNPSYLPPQHNGTWVNCSSETRMDCELKD